MNPFIDLDGKNKGSYLFSVTTAFTGVGTLSQLPSREVNMPQEWC